MNNNLKITADEGYWFGLGAFETIWVYKNKESPGTIEIPGHEPAASHV